MCIKHRHIILRLPIPVAGSTATSDVSEPSVTRAVASRAVASASAFTRASTGEGCTLTAAFTASDNAASAVAATERGTTLLPCDGPYHGGLAAVCS